jgi:hypothetical protein
MGTEPPQDIKQFLRWCADRALKAYDRSGAALAMGFVITDFQKHPATAQFQTGLYITIVGTDPKLTRERLEEAILGFETYCN